MKRSIKFFGVLAMGAAALACGEGPTSEQASGELVVHASVSSAIRIDNARAVAIGSDGRQFWTYLDRDRDFTLRLPVGRSYRIVIANELSNGGQVKVGHLTLRKGATEWLGANAPGTVDLGRLRPATSSGSSTRTMCAGCGGGEEEEAPPKGEGDDNKTSDHSDDNECHEKGSGNSGKGGGKDDDDGDKGDKDDDDCNVCKGGGADKPLEPSKDPGDVCEDKEAKKGKDGEADDEKPCPDDDDAGKDKDDDDDRETPSDKSGSAPSDEGSGGKSEGSSCRKTTECESTCSCVASTCSKD